MLSREFLLSEVAPGIRQLMGDDIAAVLAVPLVWAASGPHTTEIFSPLMPKALERKILAAVKGKLGQEQSEPITRTVVDRVSIVVFGGSGQVEFTEVDMEEHEESVARGSGVGRGGGVMGGGTSASELLRMFSANHSVLVGMKRRQEEMNAAWMSALAEFRATVDGRFKVLGDNIKRIRMTPVIHTAANALTQEAGGTSITATLSPRPPNLFVLWEEWLVGVGGRKPAKRFTSSERGKVAYNYSLRNCFWTVVDTMVRSGITSDVAIDRVMAVYGAGTSVTDVCRAMRKDKALEHGVHPSLR